MSLTDAESSAQTTDITLQALLSEAISAGMTTLTSAPDTRTTVALLSSIRFSGSKELDRDSDLRSQDARREIEGQRTELRQQMKRLLSERDLLLDFRSGEGSYQRSVALQTGRMTSLDLLRAGHKTRRPTGRQITALSVVRNSGLRILRRANWNNGWPS